MRKADCHARRRREQHVVAGANDDDIDQFVAFLQFDRDQPACPRPTVLFQRGLLDDPVSSCHQQVVILVEVSHCQTVLDVFSVVQIQQIDKCATLRGAALQRQS